MYVTKFRSTATARLPRRCRYSFIKVSHGGRSRFPGDGQITPQQAIYDPPSEKKKKMVAAHKTHRDGITQRVLIKSIRLSAFHQV